MYTVAQACANVVRMFQNQPLCLGRPWNRNSAEKGACVDQTASSPHHTHTHHNSLSSLSNPPQPSTTHTPPQPLCVYPCVLKDQVSDAELILHYYFFSPNNMYIINSSTTNPVGCMERCMWSGERVGISLLHSLDPHRGACYQQVRQNWTFPPSASLLSSPHPCSSRGRPPSSSLFPSPLSQNSPGPHSLPAESLDFGGDERKQ